METPCRPGTDAAGAGRNGRARGKNMGTRTGRVVALLISSIVAVACGASATNGPYAASVGPNLDPRLSSPAR